MFSKMKYIKNQAIQPRSLILIFIVTAFTTIISVIIELNQSKKEMLELMERQGHSLLETLLISSENALVSYEKIEDELKQRLLSNAVMIRMMYEKGMVTTSLLEDITKKNKIFRINILDRTGNKKLSSHKDIHSKLQERESPKKFLQPIIDGEVDTLIIGIKPARFQEGQRFAVAVAAKDKSIIVLNVDAEDLLKFKTQVGFGVLLKKITENPQIIYVALQNEDGIIAGSGNLDQLEDIDSSNVLKKTIDERSYKWRIANVGQTDVFEGLHPFYHAGTSIGLFRLGISMEPLNNINERLTRRVIFIGLILFVFGFVTLTLIVVRQNYDLLSKRVIAIESYSSKIINNVSDGIAVLDAENRIKTINKAGEKLLKINSKEVAGTGFMKYFNSEKCLKIIESSPAINEVACNIEGVEKLFLVSSSKFSDEKNGENTILVIRDLTELRLLEKQIERSERLSAMGELASSVAHEIRNPLNSIGTIAQQLGKDFQPTENKEEFRSLTQVVYKEVKRINEIIESFLKFARPRPIEAEKFLASELFEQLQSQYSLLLSQKNILLTLNIDDIGEVTWDKTQIKQVFINLFENAVDALDNNGKIAIDAFLKEKDMIEIRFADNGKGIPKENIGRIFNLYFTTKVKGSGIGLSVVQKIVSEHNGILSIKSEENKGTVFNIVIPRHFL
jgi:two-component system, NtrC family, sensor histidine kinase HydH